MELFENGKGDRSQFAKIQHATLTNAYKCIAGYPIYVHNGYCQYYQVKLHPFFACQHLSPKTPVARASTMSIPVALPRELRHHRPSSHASALGEKCDLDPLVTKRHCLNTLPEINMAPENQWLENKFPFGKPIFRGYV